MVSLNIDHSPLGLIHYPAKLLSLSLLPKNNNVPAFKLNLGTRDCFFAIVVFFTIGISINNSSTGRSRVASDATVDVLTFSAISEIPWWAGQCVLFNAAVDVVALTSFSVFFTDRVHVDGVANVLEIFARRVRILFDGAVKFLAVEISDISQLSWFAARLRGFFDDAVDGRVLSGISEMSGSAGVLFDAVVDMLAHSGFSDSV